MFRIFVNDECNTEVIVNFEEMAEENSECIEECVEAIYKVVSSFENLSGCDIDEPQSYYYTISCSNESETNDLENALNDIFNELEQNYIE